ncbi:enoyl-CoA hydratase/isomerase family protein [Paraburkholderia rhynchosiae]|uniref:Enoyl-CoA hydratase n=1 Tax=Paraburkholderia rhynchosiae TaxID=487049 RepID=A0A2N7WEZ6_9BURK|nr:enoyl-CoA hydratase/isomerase family protein [Paraburkholderia rhynchosiae]PMS27957.1 enoyl-CoA hydratase [Paraburkholderia rhynchosiae]CAB3722474.1 Short-chain-enoyl-CoA hydratase [Paraburkholderia rhynchosiae]
MSEKYTDSNTAPALIEVTREGSVAIVTLNNPGRRNAMGRQMRHLLRDTMHRLIAADPESRAIVLTGAGEHFCAGADISEMTQRSILQSREILAESCVVVRDMLAGAKPVVAAVEGVAFGAGLSLAVATDYVVAASNARFCAAFMRVGLIPDTGILWTLPEKIGMARAREMLTLAMEIDGLKAGEFGLANQVVEPGATLAAAIEVARGLGEQPPLGVALLKAALTEGANTMELALRTEIDYQPVLRLSKDHHVACQAFFDKTTPVFTGQ